MKITDGVTIRSIIISRMLMPIIWIHDNIFIAKISIFRKIFTFRLMNSI